MPKNHQTTKNGKSIVYTVEEPIELLKFLIKVMPNRSRNSVKSILARGQITVDEHMETQYNYELNPGQEVTILKNKASVKESALIGMNIVHEDEDIIVINKEAGLLSIATEKEKERTAHHQLMEYVRREDPANRIFVVHRLDKDTSGVMMFAKNEKVKRTLQDAWKENVKERTYVALVEGEVKKSKGYISSWLKESSTHLVYSSPNKNDGQHAITHYNVIQSNKKFSLVEIQLETGRKNQIRVHMQDLGNPVVGDKKYGSKTNEIRRLGLHAKVLSFNHPTSGKLMRFEADVPGSFFAKSK
ncbi:tRNA pseudouridine32 synthase / 23S rRNA pseudouridine746 synthase/23S rRNA pseudouridine1911/1915/1917 synthase [Virgibacillus subterraneus]|uniref:Pseudouridine synthase n=2 Tax=Virgibacillus TaxID=84406 RepID=A0A1H1GCX2_9BACI|nr:MULTISPECIES: RluA family pseudouridine synthase [Virgibacillus]SDR10728.1 tRNA pseudouridine32 synthase / 23S rRNA pseudouridine746 synthase/23S rRNA pseudouridine1911/1915/1917 synthase [Virgibacillus salinus]SEQ83929.1 tRNA pseudouridine32 synthase / 23S rRNA pseudouridine746 synthase/23S rRNA pseudouridine1911/1915/1917 synthase [Virgibacillus subterraneus]